MPAVLQRLMRHANVITTMTFYVDLDADEMADRLWASHRGEDEGKTAGKGNILGNMDPKSEEPEESPVDATPIAEVTC